MGLLLFILVSLLLIWFWGYLGWLGSFGLVGYGGKDFPFEFMFDEVACVALFMLFCCGSVALFYCHHYFSGGSDGYLLFPLVVWFLGVMVGLVVSSSMLFSLVLWEYLGLVSFFLILFYSNMSSLRASLVTLFASRFGDVSLFMLIGWLVMWAGVSGVLFVLFVLLVILTKSACYPFISWLLEAMRAPTPVSSLVHSSTLVAAGVWFLLRYSSVCGGEVFVSLFFFSLVTIIITGFCASFFSDLKKVVALSTCNNISWCVVFFVCGDLGLSLLQLLSHGVCKCYLFMSVGDLMGLSGGSQSAVGVYLSRYTGSFGVVLQSVLIISLCGLPFLGVFFSKHGLFSSFMYVWGWGSAVLLVLGFFLSYVYSVRFVLLLVKLGGGLSLGYSSSFVVISLISLFGTFVNFLGCVLFDELVEMSVVGAVFLLCVQVLGSFFGLLLFLVGGSLWSGVWESFLWGSDCVVGAVYDVFLWVSGPSVLSFYRWEFYLLGLFGGVLSLFVGLRRSFFSLNFMVCGLVFVFSLCFLVGV
uniref:NADH:ubiquinone reductase (H(+)-translocating) n=1 Tax=Brachycladium goliath TaxID=1751714 RepID=A0A140B0Z2_9TREM|nr:NADH dehydrogenase subunit 5 [Brachycladium goliath]ALN38354.1 NADH dehydrogenase subunit 5 [Brachycladium goliath]